MISDAESLPHHMDDSVMTVTLNIPHSVSRKHLELFLQKVLWENAAENVNGSKSTIIRLKVSLRGLKNIYQEN